MPKLPQMHGRCVELDRRRAAVGVIAFSSLPLGVMAVDLRCGAGVVVAVVAPLSGPLALTGRAYTDGVRAEISSAAQRGCGVTLVVIDAPNSVQQIQAVREVVDRDRASVVIGAFGYSIANIAAKSVGKCLVIDLQQSPRSADRPPNLISVPYSELFFTTSSDAREASLKAAGQAAAIVVVEALRNPGSNSIQSGADLVKALTGRSFKVSGRTIVLDSATGTFVPKP